MKWWILEDALKDGSGHYFEYILTFKEGLEAQGDSVRIIVDRTAEDWLVGSLGVERLLPRSIWARMSDDAPRWKKLLRYPIHGWQTYRACRRLLAEAGTLQPEVMFFPSVFTHHLVGLVPFIWRFARRHPNTRFLLFFPSTPICFDAGQNRTVPKSDFTAKWFPALLRALRPWVESGQVVLGTETRAMQTGLQELCGLHFVYLPHPVNFPVVAGRDGEDPNTVIGHYGATRHEKGSDLFQLAARNFLDRHPEANVRFILQWVDGFRDHQGKQIGRDPSLEGHPKFVFIDQFFDPDGGYLRQVSKTDLMVLPYRDSYRYRLSRVVIEAMLAGMPVVVTRDTTLHEQASDHGVAIGVEMDSVEDLVRGIEKAVGDLDELRKKAKMKAAVSAVHFSVNSFRNLLLAESGQRARTDERASRSFSGDGGQP